MSNNNAIATVSSGIGFTGLLGLLFIGLKLGHVIDWSWLWVLAPLWAPLALLATAFVLFCTIYVVLKLMDLA